jgi:hypothetical protein
MTATLVVKLKNLCPRVLASLILGGSLCSQSLSQKPTTLWNESNHIEPQCIEFNTVAQLTDCATTIFPVDSAIKCCCCVSLTKASNRCQFHTCSGGCSDDLEPNMPYIDSRAPTRILDLR